MERYPEYEPPGEARAARLGMRGGAACVTRGLRTAGISSRREERRCRPRLRCRGVAEVILLRLHRKLPGMLLDLSAGGCCIQTDAPIPAIELPAVEVQLTVNGIALRVAGIVRNVSKGRFANIEFTGVTPRKAGQIVELIKDLIERRQDGRA